MEKQSNFFAILKLENLKFVELYIMPLCLQESSLGEHSCLTKQS